MPPVAFPPLLIKQPVSLNTEGDAASAGAGKTSVAGMLLAFQPLWGFPVLSAVGAALPVLALEPPTERIGRVNTHTIALAIMATGYVGLYLAGPSPMMIYALMAVVGVGWASIVRLPFAIFPRKIGTEETGLCMGLINLSVVLPQLVVSLGISLLVSRATDMRIICMVSAVTLIISAPAWIRVREDRVTVQCIRIHG